MFLNKLKVVGAVALVLGTGAAVMAYQSGRGPGNAPSREESRPAQAVKKGSTSSASTGELADWVAGWPSLTSRVDESPDSKMILGALEERFAMNFPNETPLEDVLKYIQQATKRTGLPNGIPIYVDPQALQDSDKTMASTVAIYLEGIPLKTTLELALKQISLRYRVSDGLMIIESTQSDYDITPLTIMQDKALRGELTREQYKQLIEMLKLRREVEDLMSYKDGGGFQ